MGRHTVPGTGTPEPDRGFWVRVTVVAAVIVLAGVFALTRGGGDGSTPGTASTPTTRATTVTSPTPSTTPSSGSPTASPSTSAPATPASGPTTRPPTLSFTVRYPAYITVRVPGGRTLVARLFKRGAKASFDQKVLEVVNGRPQAVRFVVNGRPRKPGPAGQTEVFTVRRR